MKTQIVNMTPAKAREMLKRNTMNRPIRASHVEALRASFERGEYVMTHQGVAVDVNGVLLDGQHRLTAISLLPDGASFPMLVSTDLDRDSAFLVIDATQCKRTTSDVLGTTRDLGECGNFLAKLYKAEKGALPPTFVAPFVDWARKEHDELMLFCPSKSKVWSAAAVRSAAVITMKLGDADFVKLMYRAMVHADFDMMSPLAKSLFRSHMNGKVRAAAAYDLFARSLKVFNPANAKLSKVQITDQAAVIASARTYLSNQIFGEAKKKAPRNAAGAKSVPQANYRIAGL